MIISRSPLRITLGGGGTDLPSYYKKNEGFLMAAAINKYVYVTIMRPFKEGIYLKYSKIENNIVEKKIIKVNGWLRIIKICKKLKITVVIYLMLCWLCHNLTRRNPYG